MRAETTGTATPTASGSATRTRILTAASELFYAQGIRATSADRIIDQVGITKVTFYRHFRTKSDLVVAYLEDQAAAERAWVESTHHKGDPLSSLRTLATGIGTASCRPGFRGCAFINAAAEFADPTDPVRTTVDKHRTWLLGKLTEIATEAGTPHPETTAHQLLMLRDGAMVNGYLSDPAAIVTTLTAAFTAVITAAQAAAPAVADS